MSEAEDPVIDDELPPPPKKRSPRWKAVGLMLGLFALGGVAGATGMRAYLLDDLRATVDQPPGRARAKMRLRAMQRHLDLTPEQVTQLEAILDATAEQRDQVTEPCREGMEKLRSDTESKINAILTPEQQAKHKELLEKRDHHRRHGPPRRKR